MNIVPIKRALLSVFDKTGIVELAEQLANLQIEIISTGGTSQLLCNAGIPHIPVEEITRLPNLLEGRVKTLHPHIHGGILGRRDKHAKEATEKGIQWIDLVIVNFYPFSAAKQNQKTWEEIVEYIDIGGPTMVRAAAKNFAWVGVVVDPLDYSFISTMLSNQTGLDLMTRKHLAEKAFSYTANYDNMIHQYFQSKETSTTEYPQQLHLQLNKTAILRYGENPHQKACAYQFSSNNIGVLSARQHQGKPLSYNNILDAEAAWQCVNEFSSPTCVIVKHANPCGVASASSIDIAYVLAYQADPLSAFGGIVALNNVCTKNIAQAITDIFLEVVIAPAYTEEALAIFSAKPNLRVLDGLAQDNTTCEMRFITGGVLLQEKDLAKINEKDLKVVTQTIPDLEDKQTMLFAWNVLKHIKSNGILIAKANQTKGIGAGQVSRIDAVEMAVRKAGADSKGAVLASDAFFPFRDSIDRIAGIGIRSIIQPGGSIRDEEVIAACDEHHIAMVLTGKRCFKH
jgi:phosphoribosylaminoimidazolecarboxamide formyltransferase/IMP cyclohydrolase